MEKLYSAVTLYLAVAEIQHITLSLHITLQIQHITLQATNRHHELLSSIIDNHRSWCVLILMVARSDLNMKDAK